MKKRMLSMLLAIVMLISLLPTTVLATGGTPANSPGGEISNESSLATVLGVGNYTFDQTTSTITLSNDVTFSGDLKFKGLSTHFTLDLNGHTLDMGANSVIIENSAKTTITNSTGNGKINSSTYAVKMEDYTRLYLSGTPDLNGTTADVYCSEYSSYVYHAGYSPANGGPVIVDADPSTMHSGDTMVTDWDGNSVDCSSHYQLKGEEYNSDNPFLAVDGNNLRIANPYGIWVAGVRVTERNKHDILGDGTVSFAIKYFSADELGSYSGGSRFALTLNNAALAPTSAYSDGYIVFDYSKKSMPDPPALQLIGNNTITTGSSQTATICLKNISDKDLNIVGDGSLSITNNAANGAAFSSNNSPRVKVGNYVTLEASVPSGRVYNGSSSDKDLIYADNTKRLLVEGASKDTAVEQADNKWVGDNKYIKISERPVVVPKYNFIYKAGATTLESASYEAGTQITLMDLPFENGADKKFLQWNINGNTYNSGDTFTMPAAHVNASAVWGYRVTTDQYCKTEKDYYKSGETVVVEPADGYKLNVVYKAEGTGNAMYLPAVDGVYSFTMPAGKTVSITAQAEVAPGLHNHNCSHSECPKAWTDCVVIDNNTYNSKYPTLSAGSTSYFVLGDNMSGEGFNPRLNSGTATVYLCLNGQSITSINIPNGVTMYICDCANEPGSVSARFDVNGTAMIGGGKYYWTRPNGVAIDLRVYGTMKLLEGFYDGSTSGFVMANADARLEFLGEPSYQIKVTPYGPGVFATGWDSGYRTTRMPVSTNDAYEVVFDSATGQLSFVAPTYSITYDDDSGAAVNGSYTTSVTNSILAGTSVTINPTPAPGYQVEDILVFKTGDTGTTVAVTNNTFTMPDYSVTVKVTFAPIEHDHCVCGATHAMIGEHQQVEEKAFLPVSTEAQLQAAAESGGNVYLINDIAITNIDTVTVAAGKTLTLCLNGKKLSYAGPGKATIIKVAKDATLNITDCGTNTRAGYIDSTTKLWTEGTGNSSTDVECNLIGGVITGGTGSTTANWGTYHAGAIKNFGTVYIYSGNIAGNQAIDTHGGDGGAIFNATGSDLYVYGGSIVGNYADESIIYNYEENNVVFTGNAVFAYNTLTKRYSLISSRYGYGSMEISGNASFSHNDGGTVVDSCDEPLVVKGNASFTDNTVNHVIAYSYYELAAGKVFCMDGNILMERNTQPSDSSPAVDIDIYYNSNNMPDALITLTAPLTRSYRIELPWYLEGGVLAKGDGTNVTNLTAADAEKLTDVDGRVIVAANDVVYIGRVIFDQPSERNNYTVAATDNPSYQWYEITTDTYDITEEVVDWEDNNYDSNGKWSASVWYSTAYYFDMYLYAGDVMTLVFDDVVEGNVALMDYDLYCRYELTPEESNTYTFTAPYDGVFSLEVSGGDSSQPMMLDDSETEYPTLTASVYGRLLTAEDDQVNANLNTENLASGIYICKVTWAAEDEYGDPYILMSDTVEYHCHNYTYTASGNVISEKCTCGHEATATLTAPTGNLTYDGAEKKATVAYSDGWQGGALTVSYTPGNVNAGSVTASITKENATASVQFVIEKLMHTVTYKADGKVVKTLTVKHGKDATAPEIPTKEGYDETAPKWDKDGKNITADTTITAVYTKNEPGEYEDVTPDTNLGGGKLTEEIKDLKEKVPFTKEEEKQIEYGADVEVWLEIKDISASVPAEDKKEIDKKLGDGAVALYLDIAMFKQIGENDASRLTQLSDKVQITFKLADSYINTDKDVTRTYSIIHVHDGKAEVITPVFDAKAKTLTFETDRFSTYAVVYTDVTTKSPATGDSFQPVLWVVCMSLSVAAAALLLDNKKRCRK